jgi:hypothetical protein
MPFSGSVTVQVQGTLSGTNDMGTPEYQLNKKFGNNFKNGTGLNQAADTFPDRRTVAGGANENLDLSGALTNPLGTSITATKLKGVIIQALPTNTGDLIISRPASNGVPFLVAASDGFGLAPGGIFVITNPSSAGIAVVAATADLINISNATGSPQSYDVILITA